MYIVMMIEKNDMFFKHFASKNQLAGLCIIGQLVENELIYWVLSMKIMSKNVKGMISFLDVLIMRKNYTIETTVYRKQTHNDICLHWEIFYTWSVEAWCFQNFII